MHQVIKNRLRNTKFLQVEAKEDEEDFEEYYDDSDEDEDKDEDEDEDERRPKEIEFDEDGNPIEKKKDDDDEDEEFIVEFRDWLGLKKPKEEEKEAGDKKKDGEKQKDLRFPKEKEYMNDFDSYWGNMFESVYRQPLRERMKENFYYSAQLQKYQNWTWVERTKYFFGQPVHQTWWNVFWFITNWSIALLLHMMFNQTSPAYFIVYYVYNPIKWIFKLIYAFRMGLPRPDFFDGPDKDLFNPP
eukprot:CAMPEP_0197540390 /NCGR_PEP_ID=MMETSP1318-20131121/65610_1 /TAXON_ID=552666 /ORGANISM="Partenskyella glossopodia, Strain RCC365" /LENGTH=242 /DNA_ID=CAMNT_0043099353 /DNA_START=339 /DNA_END=1063 /DNA_ORIENTATION=-